MRYESMVVQRFGGLFSMPQAAKGADITAELTEQGAELVEDGVYIRQSSNIGNSPWAGPFDDVETATKYMWHNYLDKFKGAN